MKLAMDMLCRVFSRALDVIEEEQIGASERHSARVAAMCAVMGARMGYDSDTLSALATCALFHDNALTEYNLSEWELSRNGPNMIKHCQKGQSNVSWLPFKKNINGFILYHHERGDGNGPFGKKEGEYPFEAALLAAADFIDVKYRTQHLRAADLPALRKDITDHAEAYSTRAAIAVLLDILDEDMLESLRNENLNLTLDRCLPRWEVDIKDPDVIRVADFIGHVIDFKSKFTHKHTSQLANRAWLMANHYNYPLEEKAALYLAASLHDIGKIATPIEILEKPDVLDDEELHVIRKHARVTYDWLSEIPDFDLIRNWASDHHEKLDSTGYSFGKQGDELDFNSRLIACLDIYQAVCELRPYHGPRTHSETMPILHSMAGKGFIDAKIVRDLDEIMSEYSMQDVPSPLGGC